MPYYKRDKQGKLVYFRKSVKFNTSGDSLTEQHHKDACNINNIVAKYHKTGVMSNMRVSAPVFKDCTANDFFEIQNQFLEASDAFASLSSSVRKRFGNDPHNLIEFLDDPKNRDEAVKLGLIDPQTPPADRDWETKASEASRN